MPRGASLAATLVLRSHTALQPPTTRSNTGTDVRQCCRSDTPRGGQRPRHSVFQQSCCRTWCVMTGRWAHRALLVAAASETACPQLGPRRLLPAVRARPAEARGWTGGPASPLRTRGHFLQGHSLRSLVENVLANWSSVSAASSVPRAADMAARPPFRLLWQTSSVTALICVWTSSG